MTSVDLFELVYNSNSAKRVVKNVFQKRQILERKQKKNICPRLLLVAQVKLEAIHLPESLLNRCPSYLDVALCKRVLLVASIAGHQSELGVFRLQFSF